MNLTESLNKVFTFNGISNIRVYGSNVEPWFCGRDVARILGYDDTVRAIKKHVDIEDKKTFENLIEGVSNCPRLNHNEKNTIYINEPGLYSLILRSKLETAKQFKKWVTTDVLPSLRKTGTYSVPSQIEEDYKQLQLEFQNQIISHQLQLEAEQSKLIKQTRFNELMNNFITNIKQRHQKQIIYIATTTKYAENNLFKVGGCNSRKLLTSRLKTYNTGRPDDDLYYFSYVEETTDFNKLEKRIKDILFNFLDNKTKEMYVIHYTCLREFVEYIRCNYNSEVGILNDYIKNLASKIMDQEPIVPDKIMLNGTAIEIRHIENGEPVEEKTKTIDIETLSVEEIEKLIIEYKQSLESGGLNTNEIRRKEFELYIQNKDYTFKKMSLWKQLKSVVNQTFSDVKLVYN
jgi:prophage antirepressor-like protein